MCNSLSSGIYCIENIITNVKYIGQSVNIESRFHRHKYELNHNIHCNDYLQKAWNKYGENNFLFYVVEYCEKDLLDEKEIYYINLYNTMNRNFGYNLKSGGQFTNYYSDETKNKMSNSMKKYFNDPDNRIKQSENAKKQWSNPEIKNKISGINNGMYGRHHTDETRKRISENRVGKPIKKRYPMNVLCVELNKIFENSVVAAKELNIDSGAILKVCRGERQICGGYHWKFTE